MGYLKTSWSGKQTTGEILRNVEFSHIKDKAFYFIECASFVDTINP